MSISITEPVNKNFLSPLGFKFTIKKLPTVNYFIQSVNIPNFSLGSVNVGTPFISIPFAGDHMSFGDLAITFKVDERMTNYLEMYNWITSMGFPDNFDQHKSVDPRHQKAPGEGIYSDATLTILSSAMNPIHEVNFIDVFPVSMTDCQFDSRSNDVDYIEVTTIFKYRKFFINSLH